LYDSGTRQHQGFDTPTPSATINVYGGYACRWSTILDGFAPVNHTLSDLPSTQDRRKIIAEKLFELAKIEAGVIIFSEVMAREAVRWGVVSVGLLLFAMLYVLGYLLLSSLTLNIKP